MNIATEVAIIGAGPYGLSIATHLRKFGVDFRIFGTPMQSWATRMPKGMMLKSDGFASTLFDPDGTFTLAHYCAEMGLPYAPVGPPVPLHVFVAYGVEFQKRLVPMLEQTDIVSVQKLDSGYLLETATGESIRASRVIVAAGITHFGYLPPMLASLPPEYVSHSLDRHDLSCFSGKKIAVVGAGSSAIDIAASLRDAGAEVEVVARRQAIAFHAPSKEPRPLLKRLMMPRSGLGLGWRSRMCTDAPLLFRLMPLKLRIRAVKRHLGPAPGWFVREKVEGKVPMHLGATFNSAAIRDGKVILDIVERDGTPAELTYDHVIGATGFRVAVSRLAFLAPELRSEVAVEDDAPVLSSTFQSSVPGLYFVGVASAYTFGPLTRFAYGARFTAKHLARHLAASRRKTAATVSSSAAAQVPAPSREAVLELQKSSGR